MTDNHYGLEPGFERQVAVLCCTRPKFMGTIGVHLDPDAIGDPASALLVRAAQAVFRDVGAGPSNAFVVLQRLRRWMGDGVVTFEELGATADVFVGVPLPLPTEDEAAAELAPVLKRRVQHEAIQTSMSDYANKADMSRVQEMYRKADAIGKVDASLGLQVGNAALQRVALLSKASRLPFGIPELDAQLGGGMRRGTTTAILGGQKAGKTTACCHVSAHAVAAGHFVGYVTLEASEEMVFTRIAANLTHVSVFDIENSEEGRALCAERLDRIAPVTGVCWIKELPAKSATMLDVRAWVRECEQRAGRKMDVLVLDYADKLRSHRKEDRDLYQGMGTVYEDFRLFNDAENYWGFTVSQSTRGAAKEAAKGKRIEATDAADSQEKARVLDLLVTMSYDQDAETVTFYVGSDAIRHGRGGFETAPAPHDRAYGRVVRTEEYIGRTAEVLGGEP